MKQPKIVQAMQYLDEALIIEASASRIEEPLSARLYRKPYIKICACFLIAFLIFAIVFLRFGGQDDITSPFILTAYAVFDGETDVSTNILENGKKVPISTFETENGAFGFVISYNKTDINVPSSIAIITAGKHSGQIKEIIGIVTDPTQNYFVCVPAEHAAAPFVFPLIITDTESLLVYQCQIVIEETDGCYYAELIKDKMVGRKGSEPFSGASTDDNFKYTPITAETETDASTVEAPTGEQFTDPKTDIYSKMLNTIDHFDKVNVIMETNMIGETQIVLEYRVDLARGLSYQAVKENGAILNETYSDVRDAMITVDHTAHSYQNSYLPMYTREDTPYIPLEDRISTAEDGILQYSYRRNITNCPLASYCLVPQELAFSYLKDFDRWLIEDDAFTYLGRACIVIKGAPTAYFAEKHQAQAFQMIVDLETGILLCFDGYSDSERTRYMHVTEIAFDTTDPVKQFDEAAYAAYEAQS